MRNSVLVIGVTVAVAAVVGGCQYSLSQQAAVHHYVRARLLADHGAMDAALAELARAVKYNPTLSVAYTAAGDIHRNRGEIDLAKRDYELACDANPYAFKPHYNLGVIYQMLAGAGRAVQKVQDYLQLAVQVYLRALAIEPEDFETNLNISACYYQLGKYEMAEQYCQAAIAVKGDDPHAYSNLGIIYDSQNRLYDAIRAYKASLELDTHQSKLLLNLGSTYMRQNRLKQAIHAFELAAAEDPNDPSPWEQVGSCHYRLGDYQTALAAYHKAVSLNGRSAIAHRGLGLVYMTQFVMDGRDTELRDKALAAWHTSLEIKPDQEDLLNFVRKYTPQQTGPEL